MKFLLSTLLIASLGTPLTGSAQTTLSNVTGQAATTALTAMTSKQVAGLAIQLRLGSCKGFDVSTKGATATHKLMWYNSATHKWVYEYFGRVAPAAIFTKSLSTAQSTPQRFFRNLNNAIGIPYAHAAAAANQPATSVVEAYPKFYADIAQLTWSAPVISGAVREQGFIAMGTRAKALATAGSCGTISFAKFEVPVKNLADHVTFYRDGGDNIKCTSTSFAKWVRDGATCNFVPVSKVLTPKACRRTYEFVTKKQNRLPGQNVVSALPTPVNFGTLTQYNQIVAINNVLEANTALPALLTAAEMPTIRDLMSQDQLTHFQALEASTDKAAFLDSQPAAVKNSILELAALHEQIKSDSAVVQFTAAEIAILDAAKPDLDSYVAANPTLSLSNLIIPPKKALIEAEIQAPITAYTAVTGKPHLILNCAMTMAAPASLAVSAK